MPEYADRVAVISTTTGLGTMTLAGAVTGHQSFGTAFGTAGNTEVFYAIAEEDGDWETGIGTYLGASNSLQRDTPLRSSTGAKVAFSSGTKTVFCAWLANVPASFQSRRATDITLSLRTIASQSAPVLRTYNTAGAAALSIYADGMLSLAAVAGEMMRIDMDPTGEKYMAVRNDLLGGLLGGVRYRLSGTGGTGFVQWSSGDSGYLQMQPSTGEIKCLNNAADTGVTFLEGIAIRNMGRLIGGTSAGELAFDCAGETANTAWDIGPANNGGSGIHTVRVGRRSGTNTKVRVEVVAPNTTTMKCRMDSDGMVTAGDYFIGGNPDGVANAAHISVKLGQAAILRGGHNVSASPIEFHNYDNATIAEISPAGTSSPASTTVITRTKGDTRYAAISSLRFKRDVFEAEDLADLFHNLTPVAWIWGGEVPEDDERFGEPGLGFIAEDVVKVLPEAGRYVREDDGERKLQSLDPLALIAVLHAKIAELEARLANVEGAA